MRTSEQIDRLAEALAKAQGQMGVALKDSDNPYFRSRYADLASVVQATKKPLADNGLCVIQGVSTSRLWDQELTEIKTTRKEKDSATNIERKEARVIVRITTRLLHASGQWMEDDFELSPLMDSPQQIASCVTYGRRIAHAAICGIAPGDDDDAEAAEGRDTPAGRPASQQERKPAPASSGSGAASKLLQRVAPPTAPARLTPAQEASGAGLEEVVLDRPQNNPFPAGGRSVDETEVRNIFEAATNRAMALAPNRKVTGARIVYDVLRYYNLIEACPPGKRPFMGYGAVQKLIEQAHAAEVREMCRRYGEPGLVGAQEVASVGEDPRG